MSPLLRRKANAKVEGRDEKTEDQHPLGSFKDLARQLVGVPREEFLEAEADWKKRNHRPTDV